MKKLYLFLIIGLVLCNLTYALDTSFIKGYFAFSEYNTSTMTSSFGKSVTGTVVGYVNSSPDYPIYNNSAYSGSPYSRQFTQGAGLNFINTSKGINNLSLIGLSNWTMTWWMKVPVTLEKGAAMFLSQEAATNLGAFNCYVGQSDGKIACTFRWSGGTSIITDSTDQRGKGWSFYAIRMNSTGSYIELIQNVTYNKVNSDNTANTGITDGANDAAADFYIGARKGDSNGYTGFIDNVAVWNKALTDIELRELYNNFTVSGVASFVNPTPANGTRNNSQVNLNVSCTQGNVTLWFGATNPPVTKVLNNVSQIANWTTNVTTDGNYYAIANCGGDNSSILNWAYDTTKPSITLNPNNFFNIYNTTNLTRTSTNNTMDITFADAKLYQTFINISNATGTAFYMTNFTNATSFNFLRTLDYSGWNIGFYNVTVGVWDSDGIGGKLNYNQTSFRFNLYTNNPYNFKMFAGTTQEFLKSGELSGTNISLSSATINQISQCTCVGCSIVGNNCRVPITFYSEVGAPIQVSLINTSVAYGIDNCSNSFGIPSNATALNVSFYDEYSLLPLITNYQGIFYYNGYNYSFTGNKQNQSFCAYPNYFNKTVTGQILYTQTGYTSKIYNLVDLTSIDFNNATKQLNLYLTNLSATTTVKINWYTTDYIAIDGAILYVYKCNGDGSKTLLETSSVSSGISYVNLQLNLIPYSYSLFYLGNLYNDYSTYSNCHLEYTNELTYYIQVGTVNINQLGLYDVDCNISKSGPNSVLMSWGTNPLDSSTITGCLFSYRNGVIGQILVDTACDNLTNYINRTIPITGYSYDVQGKLYQSGYSIPCSSAVTINAQNSAKTFNLSGLFSVVLLIISLALMYAGDDMKMLVGAMVAIIGAWFFGLFAFGWPIVSAMVAFIAIIGLVGRSVTKR